MVTAPYLTSAKTVRCFPPYIYHIILFPLSHPLGIRLSTCIAKIIILRAFALLAKIIILQAFALLAKMCL